MRDRAALRAAMRIYAITPDTLDTPEDYARILDVACAAGVSALQFRDKRARAPDQLLACARACRDVCARYGVFFVVNDDVELALEVGAAAVHLGPLDRSVREVRAQVGGRLHIGASAGVASRGARLIAEGADYLGVGAIFDAQHSKSDASSPRGPATIGEFRALPSLADVPIVAIGGVTPARASACVASGADGVATIRGILGADEPELAVRAYLEVMGR